MIDPVRDEITEILRDIRLSETEGREIRDRLFDVVYEELRRLASGLMCRERGDHTLQATALVHEAYLRLVDDTKVAWENRAHFFGIAARAMREILVDHARRRGAVKRGGEFKRVTLDEDLGLASDPDIEILALEDALTRLGVMHERMAQIVDLKIFGGLRIVEIAHVLNLSRQTVHDDWRVARMWLARELDTGGSE